MQKHCLRSVNCNELPVEEELWHPIITHSHTHTHTHTHTHARSIEMRAWATLVKKLREECKITIAYKEESESMCVVVWVSVCVIESAREKGH